MTQEKFYKVTAMCGHVSKNKYIPIDFPVKAANGREAALKTRSFPRVKHSKKTAIINCFEITKEEFVRLYEANKNDDYLQCKNNRDQRLIENIEDRIVCIERHERKERDRECVMYKMRKFNQYEHSLMSEAVYCY